MNGTSAFFNCTVQLCNCPTINFPAQFNFDPCKIIISLLNKLHESKNEIDRFPQDLAGDLSLDNTILYFIWRTVSDFAFVSTHIPAYHLPGSLDDVCRGTIAGFCHQEDIKPE